MKSHQQRVLPWIIRVANQWKRWSYFSTHNILQTWFPTITTCPQTSKDCSQGEDWAQMKRWLVYFDYVNAKNYFSYFISGFFYPCMTYACVFGVITAKLDMSYSLYRTYCLLFHFPKPPYFVDILYLFRTYFYIIDRIHVVIPHLLFPSFKIQPQIIFHPTGRHRR